MTWPRTLASLSAAGTPFVLVTVAAVRGHAPRSAGSKMVVTAEAAFGSVGGGNLEAVAVSRGRELLAAGERAPELLNVTLNPQGGPHGVQCCGGEVTLLIDPVYPARPAVAIFGAGHVGWALVHVLGILPVELHVVDSRQAQLEPSPALPAATLHLHHAPIPESALEGLPAGAHLLVMTHDHAEDLAILDVALRREGFGFLGLIGSSAKWAHLQRKLREAGHDQTTLKRVTTPIGLPGVPGKSPQAIAIATAAQLLGVLGLPEQLL
jgi:xanthine dehydrogenase accessory factor